MLLKEAEIQSSRVDVVDAAQAATVHNFAERADSGVVYKCVANHKDAVVIFRQPCEVEGLGDRSGQRLFDENVFA
jgi:hypothetical protein